MSTDIAFTQEEKFLFLSWMDSHEDGARTKSNAALFRQYLLANNLRCTLRNLDTAHTAIKSQLDIIKTQAQLQEEQYETVRRAIYAEVAQRLQPAQVDFTNPTTITKIANWLNQHANGRMN